jgi:hypothetical protein
MTTLHELLKRDENAERERATPRVDLRGRYSPIGISAVAAACRYGHEYDDRPTRRDLERQRR